MDQKWPFNGYTMPGSWRYRVSAWISWPSVSIMSLGETTSLQILSQHGSLYYCGCMLKMNHDKTELIAIGTKPKISQVTLTLTPVSISGHNIPFSQSARNLGVFIDETLSMDVHIKHLCGILFCQLRRLGKIRPFPLH